MARLLTERKIQAACVRTVSLSLVECMYVCIHYSISCIVSRTTSTTTSAVVSLRDNEGSPRKRSVNQALFTKLIKELACY